MKQKRACPGEDPSMKTSSLIILCVLVLCAQAAYPANKDDASQKVAAAASLKNSLDTNSELSAFIPFDMYNAGSLSFERARSFFDDGKYNDALYHATEAAIRFEIAGITAQARSARSQRLALIGESCTAGIMTNPVMDAQFFKKGDVFRSTLYDRQLFLIKKNHIYYKLSPEGKERLDRIIKVLNAYPNYGMKIVGHTAEADPDEYSKQKADVIAKYFFEKNISSDRIEIMGLANREVMDTHLGYRRVDRVEFILSTQKGNKEITSNTDCADVKSIHEAVKDGIIKEVKQAIACGEDVNSDVDDIYPICIAVAKKNLEIVKLLIANNANINIISKGFPLITYTFTTKDIDMYKLLIKSGADINIRDNDGNTLLIEASALPDVEFVKLLLNENIDVNAKNKTNGTALFSAVIHKNPAICKLLIKKGANVNEEITNGRTILQYAKSESTSEIVDILKNAGAK
jgi:hypothetical protein